MTDATPTHPTGSGKLIWRKPLTRDEVDCAQFATAEAVPADLAPTTFAKLAIMFPDPRDARIAELEAAIVASGKALLEASARIAELELLLSPEGVPATVEELDA